MLTPPLRRLRLAGVLAGVLLLGVLGPAEDAPPSPPEPDAPASAPAEEQAARPSLVLLLADPLPLTAPRLSAAVETAFGPAPEPAAAPAEPATDAPAPVEDPADASIVPGLPLLGSGEPSRFVANEASPFFVGMEGWLMLVQETREPYFPPEALEEDALPEAARAALREHTAWRSITLLDAPPDQPEAAGLHVMAMLQRELALAERDRLRAVLLPVQNMLLFDRRDLDQYLEAPDAGAALDVLIGSNIVGVAADDPEMEAAVATARARWPEFVASFAARGGDAAHFVKAPIREAEGEGEGVELIWIEVTALEDDLVRGTLANTPRDLDGLREGDAVTVPLAELNDWMILTPEGMTGAFTVEVLRRKSGAR